jgi:ribose 5-phosphate isomerase A
VDAALSALAAKALDFVPDGARIGLGTGRAATAFLHALAGRVHQGLRVRGVPTSEAIGSLARSLGVAVDTLDADEPLAVTIDGADEVERGTLNLIKGRGGALARERIVAAASRRQVILVTPEKLVSRLGERGVLPVEVLPFAEPFCRRRVAALGLRPELRLHDGAPFVTDNGNRVLDCAVGPIGDPAALEAALCAIPGVVDTGLFLGTASLVLVGRVDGVEEMHRGQGS